MFMGGSAVKFFAYYIAGLTAFFNGLGEKAADAIMEEAKDGPFLSKDDFRSRTKVSKTVIDLMADLGLLGDIPESNQISLFDLVG